LFRHEFRLENLHQLAELLLESVNRECK